MIRFAVRLLGVFLIALVPASFAHAVRGGGGGGTEGWVIAPAVMYEMSGSDLSGTKDDYSETYLDLKIGYTLSSLLYVGFVYDSAQLKNTTSSASATTSLTGYGASIGVVTDGFQMIFSYLMSADLTYDGTTKYTRSGGTGTQVDLGYKFDLGGVGVVPHLSYKSFTYTKYKASGGTETNQDFKYYFLEPMVGFWFSI